MRNTYDKLVRDRIPEIIRADGKDCEIEVMDVDAYKKALQAKVLEEAEEVAHAGEPELAKEIADLLEVIEALCTSHGIAL